MKRESLIDYLVDPETLDQSSLPEVEELIQTFPYFQTAHMLLARNHHNLDSLKFHDMLRSAAAFAGDRTVLYHLINDKPESKELTGKLADVLKSEAETDELEIAPAYSVEDIPVVPDIKETKQPEIEEYTFTGWFEQMQDLPKESIPIEAEANGASPQVLIDKFLEESPRIKPDPDQKTDESDRSEYSAMEEDTLMTETLANIYAKQGMFKKAIYAYEKLSLKYPEKSTYFATQINRIKSNLEENR